MSERERRRRAVGALVLALGTAGVAAPPARAQERLTRGQVLAALATATPERPADFTGQDLSGLDLAGVDFKRANLTRCHLVRTNFANARLFSVTLTDAVATDADFSAANLDVAVGYRVDLRRAILRHASLFAVILPGADLSDADASGARLIGPIANAKAQRAKFVRADRRGRRESVDGHHAPRRHGGRLQRRGLDRREPAQGPSRARQSDGGRLDRRRRDGCGSEWRPPQGHPRQGPDPRPGQGPACRPGDLQRLSRTAGERSGAPSECGPRLPLRRCSSPARARARLALPPPRATHSCMRATRRGTASASSPPAPTPWSPRFSWASDRAGSP